jgi:hypothetical protein
VFAEVCRNRNRVHREEVKNDITRESGVASLSCWLGLFVNHFETLPPALVEVAEIYPKLFVLAFDFYHGRAVLGAEDGG